MLGIASDPGIMSSYKFPAVWAVPLELLEVAFMGKEANPRVLSTPSRGLLQEEAAFRGTFQPAFPVQLSSST